MLPRSTSGSRFGRPAIASTLRIAVATQLDAGVAHAELEHARVADHDHVRGRRNPGCEQFGADLGADAGDVAEHQAESRRFVICLILFATLSSGAPREPARARAGFERNRQDFEW